MDAAEKLFTTQGVRATTMEMIAGEAGYSRIAIYRQFPTRSDLVSAMVQRTTQRHMAAITERIPAGASPLDMLVESLVIVATELAQDPLIMTIDEQSPDGTVASFIANDPALTHLVELTIGSMVAADDNPFRPGLHPHDLAQFFISTALAMLLGAIPGIDDPTVARSYIETFVLPAIVTTPPEPTRVFPGA